MSELPYFLARVAGSYRASYELHLEPVRQGSSYNAPVPKNFDSCDAAATEAARKEREIVRVLSFRIASETHLLQDIHFVTADQSQHYASLCLPLSWGSFTAAIQQTGHLIVPCMVKIAEPRPQSGCRISTIDDGSRRISRTFTFSVITHETP